MAGCARFGGVNSLGKSLPPGSPDFDAEEDGAYATVSSLSHSSRPSKTALLSTERVNAQIAKVCTSAKPCSHSCRRKSLRLLQLVYSSVCAPSANKGAGPSRGCLGMKNKRGLFTTVLRCKVGWHVISLFAKGKGKVCTSVSFASSVADQVL